MRATQAYAHPRRGRRRAWASDNPGNAAARRELLAAIRDVAADRLARDAPLLDCGCGTGWLLSALAEAGVAPDRLHGVDVDPARVESARARVPGATVAVADMTRLPYGDGLFDAVFFVVSLSSMGSREAAHAALKEGRRVLAPGGALIVYEPRLPNPLNRATVLIGNRDLAAAGVEPTDRRGLTLLPALGRRLGRTTNWSYPLLLRLPPLRSHRLAVHRKPA